MDFRRILLIQKMPAEIMLAIFRMCCTLTSQQRITSYFHLAMPVPPVLVLSYVCAEWRRLLMNAPEFWSDVEVEYMTDNNIRLAALWFSRAGDIPRSFRMLSMTIWSIIERLLCQFPFRNLKLMCTDREDIQFSNIPIKSLLPLESLTLCVVEKITTPWFYPQTFPNLNYISLSGWFDLHSLDAIPASCNTLRHFHLSGAVSRSMCLAILTRIPNLESCSLEVSDHQSDDALDAASEIIAPKLVSLGIDFSQNHDLATFFHILSAPSLENLSVGSHILPSRSAVDAPKLCQLARRGATPKLRTIFIHSWSSGPFDLGLMLAHFPLISSVKIIAKTVLSENTMCQIADGVLAPCLEELWIGGGYDIGQMLNMVESRQRTVQKQLQSGVVDTILRLRSVSFDADGDEATDDQEERFAALYEQGIHVKYHFVMP